MQRSQKTNPCDKSTSHYWHFLVSIASIEVIKIRDTCSEDVQGQKIEHTTLNNVIQHT